MADLNGEALRGKDAEQWKGRKWPRPMFLVALLLAIAAGVVYFFWNNKEEKAVPVVPVTQPNLAAPKEVTKPEPKPAEAKKELRTYEVKRGDTLAGVFGEKDGKAVCELNKQQLKGNCDFIKEGWLLLLPDGVESKAKAAGKASKKVKAAPPVSAEAGVFYWRKVGGAPLNDCGGKNAEAVNEEAWQKLGLSEEEKSELRARVSSKEFEYKRLVPGQKFLSVAFCKKGQVTFRQNVVTAWSEDQAVVAEVYILANGRKLLRVRNCGNWVTDEAEPVLVPPQPEAEAAPPPPEDEDVIVPVHVTEEEVAGKPRCELQAGAGVYGNRVYDGKWAYGETICYVWKDGAWQAGPGVYGMYGSGASDGTAFSNKEYGIGFQIGAQRNWVNDRSHQATLDLKLRLLYDRSWGENPDSGYRFTQKGKKFGVYTGYTEKLNSEGDLAGVIGEYWKSFGQKVDATVAQSVQDRGSVSLSGFYETNLSDDGKWRQRFIGGWARTNWDKQNWARLTYEVRYDEWLMFGPQFTLPIGGLSSVYQGLEPMDVLTKGAFIRFELGKKVRETDADNREAQLEFIPAEEAAKQPQGGQLEFIPDEEAAKPPE